VDTDEKDCFKIGLSTKLQECMARNNGGTFPEFVSNIMIEDYAIHAHREPRRGRLWQLHLVVLLRSTERCTTTAPPIHPNSRSSTITSTSGQHLRLYLHLRL
jgi:hypothetical protein